MLKSILIFFFVKTYIRGNHTFSSTYWKLSYLCSVPGTEIAMHMPLGGAKIAASKDGRTWVLNMNMRRDINQSCKWNASMWDIDFSYFQRQCSQDFMSANESILRRLFEPLTHYLLKGNNDATLELAHTSQLPASFSNSTYNDITVVVSVVMLVSVVMFPIMVGIVTPWKLANDMNQGFFLPFFFFSLSYFFKNFLRVSLSAHYWKN